MGDAHASHSEAATKLGSALIVHIKEQGAENSTSQRSTGDEQGGTAGRDATNDSAISSACPDSSGPALPIHDVVLVGRITPCAPLFMIYRRSKLDLLAEIRGLLAVVVRAAVVSVPWVVRIIIRRVVSIIFRLGRAKPIIGVVNISAAAKQKSKGHGADQRKDRYNLPTLFPFSCHAFGALI